MWIGRGFSPGLLSPSRGLMFAVLLLLLLQVPLDRAILEVEDARGEDVSVVIRALESSSPEIQRLAVRALGRLERPRYAESVSPLLASPDPRVRMEAANAIGQMGASLDLTACLDGEKDGGVRGILYETRARVGPVDEAVYVRGLEEEDPRARTGAAKGLELYFRGSESKPGEDTILALRRAIRSDNPVTLIRLALLTLNRAGDRDVDTLSHAFAHSDPQVRRLAVLGLETPKDDPNFMVRFESLKFESDCERIGAAVRDENGHVALAAIDRLGNLGCSPERIETLVSEGRDWRYRSRALVALSKVSPEKARSRLPRFVAHETWQARTYAAEAAKILGDRAALALLLGDSHPNVVGAALEAPHDALRVLTSPDYGLLMNALGLLEGGSEDPSAVPVLLDTLECVTREGRATSRDPRREMLARLRERGDAGIVGRLRPLLQDFDPVIARLTAEIVSEKTGIAVEPATDRFQTTPVPPESYIRGLEGARARIRMKEAGTFILELLPEEAPVTAAAFARLAEDGYYNGLTFHRIVPNFVIQGGSPGANEYVGTPGYLRDEVGLLSHLRGTVGISTRGRDTGDAQIFINLVDNYRLDHSYTVFARVVEGMEIVDRILEGDVMESVEISRGN